MHMLPDKYCNRMGEKSREIIAKWNIDAFVTGLITALNNSYQRTKARSKISDSFAGLLLQIALPLFIPK